MLDGISREESSRRVRWGRCLRGRSVTTGQRRHRSGSRQAVRLPAAIGLLRCSYVNLFLISQCSRQDRGVGRPPFRVKLPYTYLTMNFHLTSLPPGASETRPRTVKPGRSVPA